MALVNTQPVRNDRKVVVPNIIIATAEFRVSRGFKMPDPLPPDTPKP